MTDIDPRTVLALPMPQPNDAEAATVRGYLVALLAALWAAGEGFSGKRPLGDSGWDWDLYVPLIQAGLITGRLDDWGGIEDVDDEAGAVHGLVADEQVRAAALQAAAILIAPALGEHAAAFRAESAEQVGGGALRLAARFEHWIREGNDG